MSANEGNSRENRHLEKTSVHAPLCDNNGAWFICTGRCKSGFCPRCCTAYAVKWRHHLRHATREWQRCLLVTLTLDPKDYDGPREAVRAVGRKRAIAETLRRINRIKRIETSEWFSSLEFFKSGWPHWHVVVKGNFIPIGDIEKSWSLGWVFVTGTKRTKNVSHAVHYATKYVMKRDGGVPAWVLDTEGRIRAISASRTLSARWCHEKADPQRTHERVRPPKRIGDRIEGCRKTAFAFPVGAEGKLGPPQQIPWDDGNEAGIMTSMEVTRSIYESLRRRKASSH